MKKQQSVLYQENQPMVSWVIVLLGFALLSNLAVFLLLIWVPTVPLWPKLLLAVVMIGLAMIIWMFRRLSIVLTESEISFGFALIRKRLRWQDIVSVREEPYLFSRFLGWGIRYDLRGTFGYIARSGMGVQIQTRRRWRYFISTDQPQKVVGIALAQIQQTQSKVKA